MFFLGKPAHVAQNADPPVRRRFTQNLLFLSLNWSPNDPILQEADEDDILQPFRNNQADLSELANGEEIPTEMRKSQEKQRTSIFRRIFEEAGGRVINRQYDIDVHYTADENASLCASFLGVSYSRRFGLFDLKEMYSALLKSKIFRNTSSSDIPDVHTWSLRIMQWIPVGFPNDCLVEYPHYCP